MRRTPVNSTNKLSIAPLDLSWQRVWVTQMSRGSTPVLKGRPGAVSTALGTMNTCEQASTCANTGPVRNEDGMYLDTVGIRLRHPEGRAN